MEWKKNEDKGGRSVLLPLRKEVCCNENFRKAVWTGEYAQITVMTIPPKGEIGLEIHENLDQIFYVENGIASVYMGKMKQCVQYVGKASSGCAVVIAADTWHNIVNEHAVPLKMFSVYAPKKHPFGTVHRTKKDADEAELARE